jgi:hypothetical protein
MQEEAEREGRALLIPTYTVVLDKYGTWEAALADAASDEPDDETPSVGIKGAGSMRYTDEEMREEIRRAYEEIGQPFSLTRFEIWRDTEIARARERGKPLRIPSDTAIQARFGSWVNACVAAIGDDYAPRRRRRLVVDHAS